MDVPLYQVDAFTDHPFSGNPAAVCPLGAWLADDLLAAIAAENNLSETAFLVPGRKGAQADYELRWFTPEVEVDLCGHATLASAHTVFEHLEPTSDSVAFSTRSGLLRVQRDLDGRLRMDLPADPRAVVRPDERTGQLLGEILGGPPVAVLGGSTWIAVLESEQAVAMLRPDPVTVARLDPPYLNVTGPGSPGSGVDFVSRYFAPGAGIAEDPVTGSAHCALTPYWADRLGRTRLKARQVSSRGGDLDCELTGDRVVIRGHAVEVIEGILRLP